MATTVVSTTTTTPVVTVTMAVVCESIVSNRLSNNHTRWETHSSSSDARQRHHHSRSGRGVGRRDKAAARGADTAGRHSGGDVAGDWDGALLLLQGRGSTPRGKVLRAVAVEEGEDITGCVLHIPGCGEVEQVAEL